MLKIIRTILIIVISVAASATTTVLLMLHYTKPLEAGITKSSNEVALQQVYFEKETVGPVEQIAETIVRFQENDVENTESVQSPLTGHRYFDYALLSKDLAICSEKVSSFNKLLSSEIQRIKEGSSSKETVSP